MNEIIREFIDDTKKCVNTGEFDMTDFFTNTTTSMLCRKLKILKIKYIQAFEMGNFKEIPTNFNRYYFY